LSGTRLVGRITHLSAAHAAQPSKLADKGNALLQKNCGRCHAIGPTGDSALKAATPMRDVYARFAPKELQAELKEGMVSKHRLMPQVEFSDEDTDAILACLYALPVGK
jgi:hypothetical protein